jgi:3-oxoacyl-[acyl-carrier protein] reductase
MSRNSLKNKVIVVTGGSGGIGNSIINKLASCDANVVAVFNQNLPSDSSYKNILWLQADVTNPDDIDKLLSFALQKFERIDVLINCAGILEPGDFSLLKINTLRKMIDVNFTSTLIITQKALSIMKSQGSGHIINLGSLGGIVPMPYSAVYSATKFALRGFSLSLIEELKRTNVKVSLITPSSVITKMLDYEAQADNSAISFLSKPISPIDVANAVLQVIHKSTIEKIIPFSQSFASKLLVFSPKIFSIVYKLLHRLGLSGKIKYLNRYCNFSLMKGVAR